MSEICKSNINLNVSTLRKRYRAVLLSLLTFLDQTDEDFFCEVSDETLEAAAGTPIGGQAMVTVGPTILIGGCC